MSETTNNKDTAATFGLADPDGVMTKTMIDHFSSHGACVAGIWPTHQFEGGVRTDTVVGTTVSIATLGGTYRVKIAGLNPTAAEAACPVGTYVVFEGLRARLYSLPDSRRVSLAVSATGMRPA